MTRLMHLYPASYALPPALALAAATALLVLPLALLAHWTLLAERGGARAWFAFVVRAQLFLVASTFLVVPAVVALGLARALGPDGGPGWLPRGLATWAPAVLVALAHLCGAATAVRRVRRRLRGAIGPVSGMRGTLRSLLARIAPILGLLAALAAIQRHEWRVAAACALAGFAIGLWLTLRQSRVLGLAPEAITAGLLRERVFALAERAGVRVEQLFVLAARDARLVNAFALQGRRVLLTDTLLEQLSRREVDAVVAHELAHLRFRHPQLLSFSLLGTIAVVFPLSLPLGAGAFALSGCAAWQVMLVLSRWFEFVADRQAVAWTGDAEALITAIVRISRANDIPLDWGPWTGLALTHPPARARALALARRGALAVERAEHLLASPEEAPDCWPYEVSTITPIAGSAARTRGLLATAWTSFAASTLAAALVVQLARLSPARWPEPLLIAAGAAAGWLVMLAVFDRRAVAAYRVWRGPLAKRLGADERARYVGLSPGAEPRLYEGLSDWDVGFLSADARGISYRGERTSFTLPRDRILDIELLPGLPGWIAAPRVAVSWRDDAGAAHVLTVRAADARSLRAMRAANARLAVELRSALATADDPGMLPLPVGVPPEPGQVTGQDPWRTAGWRTLPALVLPLALLSCAATLVMGLPFWPWSGPGAFEVFAAVSGAALLARAPFLWTRRPRAEEPRALDRAA
jgi:Zn-dependent protease with chaperone function